MGAIVGRAAELATLRAAVGQAAAGRGRVLALVGEAGIGKTTLLDALDELSRGAGFIVARGAAIELETDRPFGPLITALDLNMRSRDHRRNAVAGLVAGRERRGGQGGLAASVPDARYRAVDAICGLVDLLAADRPVALLLDDLHWADESTLLTIRRLAQATGVPVLLALTSRPPDPSGAAGATIDAVVAGGASHLRLRALGKANVKALVGDLVGGPPGPRLLALADGAGGNPLFLAELVAVLRHDGSLRAEADGVEVADGAGTADLARRLRARAARLSSGAGALVRVGAVLGSAFTLDEAARTGGWNVADLVDPLEELLRAGLLVDEGGRLVFRHDLLRRAIEDEMPPTARRALHSAAGRALADTGASAARIARHMALGAAPGDREAVGWLHRAAQEAAPRAPATAVGLLDDALALVAPDDPIRVALLTDRVEALGWSGRNAEAESLARQLLDSIEDRDVRVALRRQLALALFVGNRPLDAKDECARSADETRDDPGAHALALGEGALAAMASALPAESAELATAAIELGRASGSNIAVAVGLSVRSRLLAFEGRFEEGLASARAGMAETAADLHGEVGRYQPGMFAIFNLNDLDRFDEMDVLLREERRIAEQRGIVWAIPLHHANAANRHYAIGELADAHAEATVGLTVAEDSGAVLPVPWLHGILALVAGHRGELAGAASHLGLGEAALTATTPLLGIDLFGLAQARLAEAQRDVPRAAAHVLGAWDFFEAIGIAGGQRNIGIDAMRLALLAGDRSGAERVTAGLRRWAATGVPSDVGAAQYAEGALHDDADLIIAAWETFDPRAHPLRRARVAEEAAKVLWATGRGEQAASMLARARHDWLELGATADARRTTDLFGTLGLRTPFGTDRPTVGWPALTPTELRVANLVATGAANAVIAAELRISRRTVETHLRHVYAKVGVASRVELAVAAVKRGNV